MTVATYALPDTDTWTLVVEQVAVLATRIADTELVPDSLRNRPAAVAAVILYGREVGLPPMTALRVVYVQHGRVGLHAEAMRGLALAAGHEITYRESTSATCEVAGRRKGDETWHSVRWSIDDARRAGLLSNPSWTKYPRAMLKARATAELCRDLFGDVLGGFEAVEEIDDGTEAPEPKRRVRRTTAVTERTSGDVTGPPAPEVPQVDADEPQPAKHSTETLRKVRKVEDVPLPGEALGPEDVAAVVVGKPADGWTAPADDEARPNLDAALDKARRALEAGLGPVHDVEASTDQGDEPDPYTDEQRRAMHAAFGDLGITDRQRRLDVTTAMIGRNVKSANDLTRDEASTLLDMLRLALDSDEPLAMVDDIVRAAGLVVNEPMFNDDGEPVP